MLEETPMEQAVGVMLHAVLEPVEVAVEHVVDLDAVAMLAVVQEEADAVVEEVVPLAVVVAVGAEEVVGVVEEDVVVAAEAKSASTCNQRSSSHSYICACC